uniref:Testis development related protein n=1 Tax=Equus caballus TaxID=9796 RepID=A0A9L0T814_HORSE
TAWTADGTVVPDPDCLQLVGTETCADTQGKGVCAAPPAFQLHAYRVTALRPLFTTSELIFFLPYQVQGASFRGWKEVTSLFNKDDEQRLLESCESPRSKGTNLRLKEELKTEKKSGFWDNLALKQNIQSKKPDEIEGWEPPKLALEDVAADSNDALNDHASRPGWEEDPKGSTKYTSLASSGNSSRWSLRSAGKLVSIRRQSKGHLTDHWEELE